MKWFLLWFFGMPVLTLTLLWVWHRWVRKDDPLHLSERTVERLSNDLRNSDKGWKKANP